MCHISCSCTHAAALIICNLQKWLCIVSRNYAIKKRKMRLLNNLIKIGRTTVSRANSLSPGFSGNKIAAPHIVLIYITACLFIEKWNYKSARQHEQCISRVTINRARARAKFPDELYLRRRLKLFRNAFVFIQCRKRHLQLIRIRATRCGRARGWGRERASELKFIVYFASRCHKSKSDLLLSCQTVWRIVPITFECRLNGDARSFFLNTSDWHRPSADFQAVRMKRGTGGGRGV